MDGSGNISTPGSMGRKAWTWMKQKVLDDDKEQDKTTIQATGQTESASTAPVAGGHHGRNSKDGDLCFEVGPFSVCRAFPLA